MYQLLSNQQSCSGLSMDRSSTVLTNGGNKGESRRRQEPGSFGAAMIATNDPSTNNDNSVGRLPVQAAGQGFMYYQSGGFAGHQVYSVRSPVENVGRCHPSADYEVYNTTPVALMSRCAVQNRNAIDPATYCSDGNQYFFLQYQEVDQGSVSEGEWLRESKLQAYYFYKQGRLEEAEQLFISLLNMPANSHSNFQIQLKIRLAKVYIAQKNFMDAGKLIQEVANESIPRRHFEHFHMAICQAYEGLNKLDDAESHLYQFTGRRRDDLAAELCKPTHYKLLDKALVYLWEKMNKYPEAKMLSDALKEAAY